jgi:hypothetical protein
MRSLFEPFSIQHITAYPALCLCTPNTPINQKHGLQSNVLSLQIFSPRLFNMESADGISPSTGENPQAKSSAGRMGGNPYDPLTTTNSRRVDHG